MARPWLYNWLIHRYMLRLIWRHCKNHFVSIVYIDGDWPDIVVSDGTDTFQNIAQTIKQPLIQLESALNQQPKKYTELNNKNKNQGSTRVSETSWHGVWNLRLWRLFIVQNFVVTFFGVKQEGRFGEDFIGVGKKHNLFMQREKGLLGVMFFTVVLFGSLTIWPHSLTHTPCLTLL